MQTQLDIMHVILVASHFMQAPTMHHYRVVKRILCYVSGTIGFGLIMSMMTSSSSLVTLTLTGEAHQTIDKA